MPTPNDLRRLSAQKLDAAKKIFDSASASDSGATDEQLAEIKGLRAAADNLRAQADELEALETDISAAKPEKPLHAGVEVGKPRFESDPRRGFGTPRDFLQSVINAGRGRSDDRLKSLAAGSDEIGGYSDPYGGFMVPEAFVADMKMTSWAGDPTASLVTRIPMTAPVVKMPARVDKNHSTSITGGFRVFRNIETQTVTATRPQTELITLEANSLTGIAYATNEILTDSVVSFTAIIEQGFRDEFASKMFDERLNGMGVGCPLGIMKSPCLVTAAKVTDQVADTINYTNVVSMRKRCWGYGSAVWLANIDTYDQFATMIDAEGNLIWAQNARDNTGETLLGRPIHFVEECKTLGDLGDLVLGNFSQYLYGLYQPIQGASSIHVRFVNNESCFRFSMRDAGAPWWSSDLTPKNSTSTLSPFVTLAARA